MPGYRESGNVSTPESQGSHLSEPVRPVHVGDDVIGSCGHKIGEVVAVRDDVLVVEKGFFMPVDFFIPRSAVQVTNEHGLYLSVSKADALHRGWDKDPALAKAS